MKRLKFPITKLEDLLDKDDLDIMLRKPSFVDVILNDVGWSIVHDLVSEFQRRRPEFMQDRRQRRRKDKKLAHAR